MVCLHPLWLRTVLVPALTSLCLIAAARADESEIKPTMWDQIKQGGYVLMVRNTTSPLTKVASPTSRGGCVAGNEPNDNGHELAINLGRSVRDHAVPVARVLSSPACASVETAQLAFGRAQSWNEFEAAPSENAWRQRALAGLATQVPTNSNVVLVTDKATIHQLTNQSVRAGEILVLKAKGDELVVTGFVRAALQ